MFIINMRDIHERSLSQSCEIKGDAETFSFRIDIRIGD